MGILTPSSSVNQMANKCLINVRNIRSSGKLGELHPSVSTECDCCKNYFASIALGADWMATCQINRLISSSSFCLAPIYYFNKLGLFTLNRAELFSLAAINQWAGKSSSIQQPADLHPAWHRAFDAFPWSVRSVSMVVWQSTADDLLSRSSNTREFAEINEPFIISTSCQAAKKV